MVVGLATAAAAALKAPTSVWIAMVVLAGLCLIAAGLQHWREGNADENPPGPALRTGIDADQGSLVRTKRTKIRNQDTSIQLRGGSTHEDEDSEIE